MKLDSDGIACSLKLTRKSFFARFFQTSREEKSSRKEFKKTLKDDSYMKIFRIESGLYLYKNYGSKMAFKIFLANLIFTRLFTLRT